MYEPTVSTGPHPGSGFPGTGAARPGGGPPKERPQPRSGRRAWLLFLPVVGLAITTLGWVAASTRARILKEQAERSARERRWDQVEEALAAYVWYRPSDPSALRLWAHAAYQTGKTEEALGYLKAVPESSSLYPASQIQRAAILMDRFRLREAEAVLLDSLRYDASSDEAQRRLLGIYGLQRRSGDCRALLWRAYRPGLRGLVTLILLAPGMPTISATSLVPDAANEEEALRRWMAADPDDLYVRPLLAVSSAIRAGMTKSRGSSNPGSASIPATSVPLRNGSDSFSIGEMPDRPPVWLDPISGSARSWPVFWILRGRWLEDVGRIAEAEVSYREAIRLEPAEIEAHLRLQSCLRRHGQNSEADRVAAIVRVLGDLKILAVRIGEHPDRHEMWCRTGQLCARLGRIREARGWFEQVLRVEPDHAEARDFLRSNPESSPE